MRQGTTERVAENLRAELGRRRVSGNDFSRRMGWTQTNGWRRINGLQALSVDEVEAIASELGIPVSQLMSEPARESDDAPVEQSA